MINVAIYVVIIAVILFLVVKNWSQEKSGDVGKTTVPGLVPSHPERGNLDEIGSAGSLQEFLVELHRRYGHIVSFWMGKQLVMSVASPDLLKKLLPVFDRPPELFKLFEPMIGSQSIQYANSEEGRSRRNVYDKAFSHDSLSMYYSSFQEVTDGIAVKWSGVTDSEHVSVCEHMMNLAIKTISITAFGEYFKDDGFLKSIRDGYDICWTIMEESLTRGFPEASTERFQRFQSGLNLVRETVRDLIAKRRESPPEDTDKLFIDYLLDFDQSEERIVCDSVSYMIGGFHTTGSMLTWAFYFLASNPDVQERLVDEIKEVLGEDKVTEKNISHMKYLRQVQEETLRCCVLAPWAAKFLQEEIELGGHIIPKNTPIITAIGVLLQDEAYWPEPDKFDPERFSPENIKKRPAHVFSPFGVAGKRICPGYRFAYSETAVVLVTLLRRFRVKLVGGENVRRAYGLVTRPSEDIWITVEKR